MIDRINNFQVFARKLLDEIQGADDPAELYRRLCATESKMRDVPASTFRPEFHALILAFATLQWQELCGENRIGEEVIQRAFLRTVTKAFQSPQTLAFAETYSGYLHASAETGSESPTILLLATRFFQRLGLGDSLNRELVAAKIHPAFADLVLYLEGFKSSFASHFDAFVTSNMV